MALRPALPWAVPLAVLAGAVAVAVLFGGSAAVAALACAAVAAAGAAIGWRAGESRRAALARQVHGHSGELRRALTELDIAQAETVRRLSMAVEFRDEDTGAHIERIGRFSTLLAEEIGMDGEWCELLSHAAPLHDVGKVAIPDSILLKPGPLTAEERAIVETHAEEGYRLLRGSSSAILEMAATIALSHHEKWDGTGYPRGVTGEKIPLEGRIVAIVDVFDALTTDRVYRKAFSFEQAIEMMREQRGRHFDPILLDAFLEILGTSDPEAPLKRNADPEKLMAEVLATYATAIERGDAETAEGAIAQAIEDGIPPATLHDGVIAPAIERIARLREEEGLSADAERLATGITRRILATMHRYMMRGSEPSRERVLVAGVQGDEQALEAHMMRDQLAAAGFQTVFETDLAFERMASVIDGQSPQAAVIGASRGSPPQEIERLLDELRERYPELPVVLGGAAARESGRSHREVRVIERIGEAVAAVEDALAVREHALS